MGSPLEDQLLYQIEALGLPRPEVEYRFTPPRRFRFDLCWPSLMLAVECEGGTWTGKGRHSRGKGFENDCEKYNLAARMGWALLRFTSTMIKNGIAINTIAMAIEEREKK